MMNLKMKFAHLADCHIGAWREPKLKDANLQAFVKAIDTCIEHGVDFILISGDLFNTSLPPIDQLKSTVIKLRELKDKNIAVYIIAGSHDFSPSGKTMLDVLESAELLTNATKGEVVDNKIRLRFTIDKKTGAKITGMLGRRGSLEKGYYESLALENLESEEGYKIFMFHSAITELKPKSMEKIDSQPLSLLPKNFNYYAGGHPHFVSVSEIDGYGSIAYPGPLFPNNFKELEELGRGGFYIVDNNKPEWHPIQICNVFSISINCEHKTPEQVKEEVLKEIRDKEFNNTIVMIRLEGALGSGKPSDIEFKHIFKLIYDKSAYLIMKNTSSLTAKEFEEIKMDMGSVEDIELRLVREHLGQIKIEGFDLQREEELIKSLMEILNKERNEGERVADFENRVRDEIGGLLGL